MIMTLPFFLKSVTMSRFLAFESFGLPTDPLAVGTILPLVQDGAVKWVEK